MECHVFFGLGIEAGIYNETIDEDPYMVSDLMWFDVNSSFVFLLDLLSYLVLNQFGDMVHMSTSFRGCNAVDKRHLLKSIVGEGYCHLPSFTRSLMHTFDLVATQVFISFDEEVYVVLNLKIIENKMQVRDATYINNSYTP